MGLLVVSVAEDESYNEAAHTLLTIGNMTQFPENEVVQDHSTGQRHSFVRILSVRIGFDLFEVSQPKQLAYIFLLAFLLAFNFYNYFYSY